VTVPEPAPGEVQVKNIWMTVDPYMRGRMVDRASYCGVKRPSAAVQPPSINKYEPVT
jgi:NADPH-dependent curcumin reductase CurA